MQLALTPAIRETLMRVSPHPCPMWPDWGTLTCWLTIIGPVSQVALCVHRCSQTHQLHPQRLLTQAWQLQRTSHGIGVPKGRLGAQGQGAGRDLRCRRVEVSDSRTVIESEGGLSDQDGAESQLHTHHDVVCKEARGGVQDQSGVSTLKGRGARLGEQPSKHKAKGVRVHPSPTPHPMLQSHMGEDGASRPPSLTHRLLWAVLGHHSVPGKSTSRLS